MSLSNRIQSARNKLGLSQSEASKTWGINLHTLQGWEIGRHEPRGFARTQLEKLLTEVLGHDSGQRKRK
ncbi:MAG TPA: hypothetical protein VGM64_13285 [Lacunisphaera sp.]